MSVDFENREKLGQEIKEIQTLAAEISEKQVMGEAEAKINDYLVRSEQVIVFLNKELGERKSKHEQFQNQLLSQVSTLEKNILENTPKGWQNNILSFFGIIGGALAIVKTIWDWWQKKEMREQLDEMMTEVQKNTAN